MTEKLSETVNIEFSFKYLSRANPTQPVSRRKNLPFEKKLSFKQCFKQKCMNGYITDLKYSSVINTSIQVLSFLIYISWNSISTYGSYFCSEYNCGFAFPLSTLKVSAHDIILFMLYFLRYLTKSSSF